MNMTIDGQGLDHFETTRQPADASHDKVSFHPLVLKGVPASTRELELWERVFPREMPATHRIAYRWVDKGGRSWIEVGPELTTTPVNAPALTNTTDPDLKAAFANETERTRLDAMELKELRTMAVEKNISIGPKWSKATLVAAILAKNAEK